MKKLFYLFSMFVVASIIICSCNNRVNTQEVQEDPEEMEICGDGPATDDTTSVDTTCEATECE